MKKLWEKIKNFAKKAWIKCKKFCKKAEKKIVEAAEWITKHPEAVYIFSIVASIGMAGVKKFRKTAAEREREYQRTRIYDYSLGHHWILKRELTTSEMKEYERRKDHGENVGDILESMRVLA